MARAAYSGADIVLMDDSLSAVDAYVGKSILENCLLSGPLADKTRVLVTHALHVLDKTDYIYVMDNGNIVEQGSYQVCFSPCRTNNKADALPFLQDLMADSVVFSRLMDEFGNLEKESEEKAAKKDDDKVADPAKDKAKKVGLIQEEERLTGSVAGQVYAKYFRFAGGLVRMPVILVLLAGYQGASGMLSSFCAFSHL